MFRERVRIFYDDLHDHSWVTEQHRIHRAIIEKQYHPLDLAVTIKAELAIRSDASGEWSRLTPSMAEEDRLGSFQGIFISFPKANGFPYSEVTGPGDNRRVRYPILQTLDALAQAAKAQMCFALRVLLKLSGGKRVLLIAPAAGMGAFLDGISREEQADCRSYILDGIIQAVHEMRSWGCFLVMANATYDSEGRLNIINQKGVRGSALVNTNLRDRILAGPCDCAEAATRIAGIKRFSQVGVLMASDTGRLGNSCFNLRRAEPAFSAEGAAEENMIRRITMATIVLSTQAADFSWNEVSRDQRDSIGRLQKEAMDITGGLDDHNAILDLITKYGNLRYASTSFLYRAFEVGRNAEDIQQVLGKRGIEVECVGINETFIRHKGCVRLGDKLDRREWNEICQYIDPAKELVDAEGGISDMPEDTSEEERERGWIRADGAGDSQPRLTVQEDVWLVQYTRSPSELAQALRTGPELAAIRNEMKYHGYDFTLDSGGKIFVRPEQYDQVLEYVKSLGTILRHSYVIVGDSFFSDLEAATAGIPSRKNVRLRSKSRLPITSPESWSAEQLIRDANPPRLSGRKSKRGQHNAQTTGKRNKFSRLITEANDSEGLIGGVDLPEMDDGESEPLSTSSAHVGQWLKEISAQEFDGDQIVEAVNYIRRAGVWGTQNLIFSYLEPFYGLNGNHRLGKKERTLMREVAETLCRAVFAPQINPAWTAGTHMWVEEHMKDPAFEACAVATQCLGYSAASRRLRGGRAEHGLGLTDLPWSHILNEIIGRALEVTVEDANGADGVRVRADFDFRHVTSDIIIKKFIEADLVTSDQFYKAFATILR